jgi:ATP-binding cassette subfamily F protein 3
MIDIRDIKKDYAGTVILDGVSAHIARGEKVALIGRNGAGKTTLLGILAGDDADYSGTVSKAGDVSIETVPQRFPDFAGTALDFVSEGARRLRHELGELEASMGSAEGKKLDAILVRYGELRERYERTGGDEAEERAGRYLEGLGLGGHAHVEVSSLSGGEKNVLALARAIAARPELLVLDEPGNHLDFWGLTWLEGFIREYPGAVLVVSHNRYLLDRTVTRVIEIEGGKAVSYAGNFSAYRIERLRKAVAGGMAYKTDMKKLERLEELVKRFETIARAHPDPKWGRRLRARRTQLEKARENARDKPVDPDASFSVAFAGERSRADFALTVTAFSCTVGENGPGGERTLLEGVSLAIEPGERVALVGRNGSGKTTFLDAILREGRNENPLVRIGPSMKVAYVTQHGDRLDRDATLLDACIEAGSKNALDAEKALSRFLFPRDSLARRIGSLSGGELNRLQLALASIARANFLILDEPTNHLDIASCEAVEDAIAEFEGTILVVSHDRFFLDRVATRVVEIEDRDFVEHDGNFSEFWYRKYGSRGISPFATGRAVTAEGRAATVAERATASRLSNGALASDGKAGRNVAAKASGGAKDADAIERRIVALEAERERIERELTAAYGAGDLKKARALGDKLAETGTLIDRLYADWN